MAHWTFLAPATPGDYEVRFFAVNSYARLATSGTVTVAASPAALSVNGTAPPTAVPVSAGTYVTLDVTAGPGHPGDWVGLYAANAADPAFLAWRYLNGSTTLPVSGVTDATLAFGVPLTAGSFEFRFFSANTYTRLATSTSLVVSAASAQMSINGVAALAGATALPGTQAVLSVAAGPGNVGDWVGLYPIGAADHELLDWRYLNDTGTAPATGLTTGTLHFAVPNTAGTYEFRFFMDNTYGRLATSGAMVVPQTPAQIAVNGTAPPTAVTVAPGSTLTATLSGGPGNAGDWVALAAQGALDASFVSWQYLNGSTVAPTSGLTNATLSVTLPASTGTYELRLFASNSYQRIVTSAPVVASTAPPVVTIALTSPFPGTTFNAPASLTVAAQATITGGTLQRVDFFDGAGLIGSASAAPFTVTWAAPTEGLHTLTAVAVDQTNATTTSAPLAVIIAPAGPTLGTLAVPVANPPGGTLASGQLVTLTAVAGTTVYYTTDGSTPDELSSLYTEPLTVSQSMVLRARAFQAGWTESVPSHDTYVIDTAGPTIVATIAPGPNAAGWNNTPVTVSFECTDPSAVTSCPASVAVTEDGAGQLVNVTAQDALGFLSALTVTVNIDSVAPVVTLTAPTADLSTTAATLALSGTVTDAGSGLALAQCGGQLASVSGAAATCIVPLLAGQNTVVLAATDLAGNAASAGLRAARTAAPTALAIAPTTVALAVSAVRGLTVTTDAGLTVSGLTWVSSNPSVVSIAPENDGTIVAEALGTAVVTASLDGLSAQATVRVLPGGVAPGEAIWTVAPTPGRYLQAPMRANPALDSDPDMFSIEVDPGTSATVVTAVRGADGATLWSEAVAERPLAADAFGGVLVRSFDRASIVPGETAMGLRRIGAGGIAPWEYVSPWWIGSAAAAPDGTVYLTEYALTNPITPTDAYPSGYNSESFVVALDGRTGVVRFRVPMPASTIRFPEVQEGSSCPGFIQDWKNGSWLGDIAIVENGDAVVQMLEQHYRHTTTCTLGEGSVSQRYTLRLLRVSPGGSVTATELDEFSNVAPDTQGGVSGYLPAIGLRANRPDGRGGVLATWSRSTDIPATGAQTDESFVSRVVAGGVAFHRVAEWATSDRTGFDGVMVTNDGVIYVPDGPNGEMVARRTDTWAPQWTTPSGGLPIQGLDNGGLNWLTWDGTEDVVQELDATGAIVRSAATDLVSPLVVLRDQDVVHGIDGASGSLAMFSASSSISAEWTSAAGAVSQCTPGVLLWDVGSAHKGLLPRVEKYTYAFEQNEADPAALKWTESQRRGVERAFMIWDAAGASASLAGC